MGDELTESDAYSGRLKTHASNATSKAEAFPHDIAFHRSLDPDLAGDLDAFSERILSVTNKMLGLIATVDQSHSGRSKRKAKLENQDDVVDNFYSLVVDATDLLLERAVCHFRYLLVASLILCRISVWTMYWGGIKRPPSLSTCLSRRQRPKFVCPISLPLKICD